ncbi:MAG TPA: VCBS repeat-containing protein [Pyrinomonadaceae bacterium]|nr:VCBS repeat-containing protein [Pyrinomonadaceae bacterium]
MFNINSYRVISFFVFVFLSSFAVFAAPPANDNFANAEQIGNGTFFTADFSASNVDATSEAGEPNQSNFGAGKSIWYKWTAPADPRPMQIATHGTAFKVFVNIYSGTALNNLVMLTNVSYFIDASRGSYVLFFPQPNTTYYFSLDGVSANPVHHQSGIIKVSLAPTINRQSSDFDRDGKTDIGVFRPSNGAWYMQRSSSGGIITNNWGTNGDIPVTGDFKAGGFVYGNGDYLLYRPSTGTFLLDYGSSPAPPTYFQWGQAGDIPVTGDFFRNNEGGYHSVTDFGIFRTSNGEWYFAPTNFDGTVTSFYGIKFGQAGDIPVWGDYDLDAKSDYGVFRPSTGTWYINSSQNGLIVYNWGKSGDIPVRGDFDGDGRNDFVVYRPSEGNWYVTRSSNNTWYVRKWGANGDVPLSGDYDGDGKFDLALFRPSNSTFYIASSALGTTTIQQWGMTGDIPLSRCLPF